jgi:hypothetical protein
MKAVPTQCRGFMKTKEEDSIAFTFLLCLRRLEIAVP